MPPRFFTAAPLDVRQEIGARELAGACDGVAFEAHRRWWGRRWIVASHSELLVPEPLLVFASRKGMEHGFWRDFRVGDARFDREHFVFSDTPALLPLILGPATRAALAAAAPLDDALALYIRGGLCRVTGTNDGDDEQALRRHLAVHRGLATDHQAFLAAWKELVSGVHGRAEAVWPPVGVVMTRVGGLRVFVRWTPATETEADWLVREDSLRTVIVGHDGRPRARWSVKEVSPGVQPNFEVGTNRYLLSGAPTLARPVIEQLVRRTQFVSLTCSRDASISVRGIASESQLSEMVRAIEQILQATDTGSPYR